MGHLVMEMWELGFVILSCPSALSGGKALHVIKYLPDHILDILSFFGLAGNVLVFSSGV